MKIFIAFVLIVIVTSIAGVWIASTVYKSQTEGEIETAVSNINFAEHQMFSGHEKANLPAPVKKYLFFCGANKHNYILSARITESGLARMNFNDEFKEFQADRFNTVDPVFRLSSGSLSILPMLDVKERSVYSNGEGRRIVKFLSLVKTADDTGLETDVSELVAFLADAPFFPTIFLEKEKIYWSEEEELSARAVIFDGKNSATGVFYFGNNGEIKKFISSRYQRNPDTGKMTKRVWVVNYSEYEEFEGLKIPTRTDKVWKLREGDFVYSKMKLKEIDFKNETEE